MTDKPLVQAGIRRAKGLHQLLEIQLNMLGINTRDERGGITVEGVVLTVMLTLIAAAAGAVLLAKMTSNANAIPDTPAIPTSGD